MKTIDFDYELPPGFIAQSPTEPRDHSRLFVYSREFDTVDHVHFFDIPEFMSEGDVLVLNKTRVIRARLLGRKSPGGGRVEIFLIQQREQRIWEVIVGGKGLHPGRRVDIDNGPSLQITEDLGGIGRLVEFDVPVSDELEEFGFVPLPPYINKPLQDPDRYQTVYARDPGSVAAPTAGLHFTQDLMGKLSRKGVGLCFVTLHVGLDTFLPVTEQEAEHHAIHTEWCQVNQETADQINLARDKGKRIIAVGTTTVRTLESNTTVTKGQVKVEPYSGATNLFILPGYDFKIVDGMITNFHLPRSTLIMMVSAFTGRKKILELYEFAKQQGYRFYSFGDAMLIL